MMIEGSKQQQLTFDKGITNVPSDAICSDNAIAESVGMVYDDGEHRVIQKPKEYITFASGATPLTLLYVHKFNDQERFIGYQTHNNGYRIRWGTRGNDGLFSFASGYLMYVDSMTDILVTSVGKTLVINTGDDILYFIWRPDGTYYGIGKIPEPEIEFKMFKRVVSGGFDPREQFILNSAKCDFMGFDSRNIGPRESNQDDYNNLVIGMYAKNLKAICKRKRFAEPFVLRYALELFDGSFIMQSAPIMLFPAITENTFGRLNTLSNYVTLYTQHAELIFKASFDYSEWSDIVKDVVVFASDGIPVYDTSDDQKCSFLPSSKIYHDIIRAGSLDGKAVYTNSIDPMGTYHDYESAFSPLNQRTTQDILDDLKSTSVFYKIFSIGTRGSDTWERASSYIKSKTLENITTQEQLTDDYYSHCGLSSKNMTAYNFRLILANVKRGFYEGASSFLPYHNNSDYTYDVYVYIKTPSGNRVIKKSYTTDEKMGIYFFYPDPRAYKAIIFVAGSWLCTLDLKEHPYLGGAYYFENLPDGTEPEPTGTSGSGIPSREDCDEEVDTDPEVLNNQIWTSEVNNPFVFRAEGNITVGNGNIVGVSSLTQALSQGQFGQYPLIIFTDEGIWAASTGATGLFTSIHPMSREVCNNANSITQTDGAIFFSSKKGLMVVVGSVVKCVSEQLSGKTNVFTIGASPDLEVLVSDLGNFCDYLKNAFIAYDYRDSLLWIFNSNYTTCYIYSIKSGTFGKFTPSVRIDNVTNYYPDYLLQDSNKNIFSLTERYDINSTEEQANSYTASLLTRPLKLENALALKSIMHIRHVIDMDGSMTMRIFASNNLDNWVELHSLRGTPWKYYRFLYNFANLKATDRFAGTMLITQERRTNKIR